jgi:hypothetical protein
MRFNKTLSAIVLAFVGLILCVPAQAQRTATATPTVANGFIIAVSITDGGSGYTNAPLVTISGGGGSGALAIATVLNGAIDKVIVENAGKGYTGTPAVVIDAPPSPKPPFSDGLVAYYPFDGNANDESGMALPASVQSCTLTYDRFIKANSAYHFTGTSKSHMDAAVPSLPVGSNPRTITCWFNGTRDLDQLFYMTVLLEMGDKSGSKTLLSIQLENLYGRIVVNFNTLNNSNDQILSNPVDWWSNGWHMLAVRYSEDNHLAVYLDGGVVTFPSSTYVMLNTAVNNHVVSINGYGTSHYLTGDIDDIRIYNRALSDQELQDLYFYEAPEPPLLKIQVKTVQVTMTVKPTKKYLLMSSLDLKTWTNAGQIFVANTSEVVQEFDTTTTGRYFRLSEVQ